MNAACPISGVLVNEHAARVNALITVVIVAISLYTQWYWLLFLLAIDFAIRGFWKPKYSPIAKISNLLLQTAGVKPSMTDGGPKMFAAKIGFIFCVAIGGAYYAGLTMLGLILAGMIMVFALLESLCNYCVGCKMYTILRHLKGC